jgi:hypothetical protein
MWGSWKMTALIVFPRRLEGMWSRVVLGGEEDEDVFRLRIMSRVVVATRRRRWLGVIRRGRWVGRGTVQPGIDELPRLGSERVGRHAGSRSKSVWDW